MDGTTRAPAVQGKNLRSAASAKASMIDKPPLMERFGLFHEGACFVWKEVDRGEQQSCGIMAIKHKIEHKLRDRA